MAQHDRSVRIAVNLPWNRQDEPDTPAVEREIQQLWIIEEVRQHRLGVGKGSELAGLPRAAFMSLLGTHGVPVIDYPLEDLDRELTTLGIR